jgi:acetylornithine/succinyldiaminopimelate/putrescine aminotransferase
MGSMSVMGFEERKASFPSLIPDVDFNNEDDLQKITTKPDYFRNDSGAGFIQPQNDFLKKVRKRCTEVGAMMILDEIQPGFGRTGAL